MMNKLSILLLLMIFTRATVLCDCQLKENARDLLYVGYSNYFTADGNLNYTDIDKIEVRMKEEKNNFGLWLFKDGCSEKTKKTTKLSTKLYKRRESEEIEVRNKTRRAGVVEFEDLDPCAVYIVSVTIGKHKVGRYKVGPYYTQDDVQHPLLNNDQNPNLMNNSEIKTVTSSKDRAVFKLGPVCAKMVILHLHEQKPGFNDSSPWLDLEKTTISNVTKISPNTKGGTEVVVENLKPCTLYSVDIELSFGDKRSPTDEEDFIKDRIFYFYTMPDNKDDSQSRQKSRRESNVVKNVVKSGDTAKMPIE